MTKGIKVPVLLPTDGTQDADVREFTMIPKQDDSGLHMVKDPAAGTFISLSAFHPGLGYVTARTRDNTASTKVRILISDHPDGG